MWLPLHQHLDDTGRFAARLWDEWLPNAVKDRLTAAAGENARSLTSWLAALHDVGKLSPAFAVQSERLGDAMAQHRLYADPALRQSEERKKVRHEVVSHLAVAHWLRGSHGFTADAADALASVLAAHHGLPPDRMQLASARHQSRLVGAEAWHATRLELLRWITERYVTDDDLARWRTTVLPQTALVLLSALVIVADWMASSEAALIPLGEQPGSPTDTRVSEAWSRLRPPAPWTPSPPADDGALFRERFELGDKAVPRPGQAEMMRLARSMRRPSLMIFESDMGSGKTEAALAAAEILAHRFSLGGIAFWLPTRATADGMFARGLSWARRVDLDAPMSVYLAHGSARLNDDFSEIAQDGRFRALSGGRHGDDDRVIAHHWFTSPKRGPLASLVIGTVDQALFAVLRGRHAMMRHLAMAGKVVIFDEVHAFDAYTNVYLERLLHWLGAYEVPVIMLSATLPAERRRAFADAYDGGRRPAIAPVGRRPGQRAPRSEQREAAPQAMDPYSALGGDIGYPAITVTQDGRVPLVRIPPTPGAPRTITLDRIDDGPATLLQLLERELTDGGVAVVIRNTVQRVQETAEQVRTLFGHDQVTVAHSRFLGVDRARKDRGLIERFGKGGKRPFRHVVVATQVVEQSLDVDFDLMVSDLAPVDLLLQRAGRLHRHPRRDRPPQLSQPRLVITGVDWTTTPPEPVTGSRHVYGNHLLYRTLAALDERDEITLPADIPTLVQAVYGDAPLGPSAWGDAMAEALREHRSEQQRKTSEARVFLLREAHGAGEQTLLGWVHGSAGDPSTEARAKATVRDGEDTLEVIVLQRDARDERVLRLPDWIPWEGERQVPDNEPPSSALTRAILGCVLRLPAAMTRGDQIDRIIRLLEDAHPLRAPWQGSPQLRGELLLVLAADGTAELGGWALHYDPDDGLSVTRGTDTDSRGRRG